MTTTQKEFKNIEARIEELKNQILIAKGNLMLVFLNKELKNKENKLSEIAMQLTAERYANEY
jgi:hypothetical protein